MRADTRRYLRDRTLGHARQGAVYARAHGNYGMRFAYVKPSAGKRDGRAVVVNELDRLIVSAGAKIPQ